MNLEQASPAEKPLARLEAAFPKTQLPQSELRYRRSSAQTGRPIIMLPGASGTSEFFCLVAPILLEEGCDPILVDYPGTLSPDDLVLQVRQLAQSLRLDAPVALGCSYSAWWLQRSRAPDLFDSLILCNGFVEAEDLKPNPLFQHDTIAATDAGDLRREWAERAAANTASTLSDLLLRAMTDWLPAEDLKGRLLEVSSSRPVPGSAKFSGTVTVIDCADDPIVGPPARARFRDSWQTARHVELSGGHYPYVNAPDAFAGAVLTSI